MKKKSNLRKKVYLILGTAIVVTTPLVQPIVGNLLTQNCPMLGNIRECGLAVGYKNAFYAEILPILWLAIGVVILAIGIVKYFVARKNDSSVPHYK